MFLVSSSLREKLAIVLGYHRWSALSQFQCCNPYYHNSGNFSAHHLMRRSNRVPQIIKGANIQLGHDKDIYCKEIFLKSEMYLSIFVTVLWDNVARTKFWFLAQWNWECVKFWHIDCRTVLWPKSPFAYITFNIYTQNQNSFKCKKYLLLPGKAKREAMHLVHTLTLRKKASLTLLTPLKIS